MIALIVYLCTAISAANREKKRRIEAQKLYSNPKIVKMDYDLAYYDAETEARMKNMQQKNAQVSIEDLINTNNPEQEVAFTKLEASDEEEITGTYRP